MGNTISWQYGKSGFVRIFAVGRIDYGGVTVGFLDARLEFVGDQIRRYAPIVYPYTIVGTTEGIQFLDWRELRESQAAKQQHSEEKP